MDKSSVLLPALEVSNPLSFLAAIGVLRSLDHEAKLQGTEPPRLAFVKQNGFRPVIHGASSLEELIETLFKQTKTWATDEALQFGYDSAGKWLPLAERAADAKLVRDLKPEPETMRDFLEHLARRIENTASPLSPAAIELRRTLDTASAYGTEINQATTGNTKPTAFHFTAGTQRFLDAVVRLNEGVTVEDFEEALRGPWRRDSRLPNMGWDATYVRAYALRAENPSDEHKTTLVAADWLAYIGLGAFPTFPRGKDLATTGIFGGWYDSVFVWPIWSEPLTYRVAVSLLRLRLWEEIAREKRFNEPQGHRLELMRKRRHHELDIRKIEAVFVTKLARTDQGGYGSFAPAEITR